MGSHLPLKSTAVVFNVCQRSSYRDLTQTVFLFLGKVSGFSITSVSCSSDVFIYYHSCTSADAGKTLSIWFFYLAAMLYDIVMVTISTMHLLHYNPLSSRCALSLVFRNSR
jgi:hypothetical protein